MLATQGSHTLWAIAEGNSRFVFSVNLSYVLDFAGTLKSLSVNDSYMAITIVWIPHTGYARAWISSMQIMVR